MSFRSRAVKSSLEVRTVGGRSNALDLLSHFPRAFRD